MDTNKKNRELISAFSDAEIPDDDKELALAALGSPDGQQTWEVFHRIGDALRARAGAELSADFSARLAARLAGEPLPGKRSAAATEAASPTTVAAGPR